MVNVKLDGALYECFEGETIMELAKRNNINIPGLCFKKGFEGLGRCRLCTVEATENNKSKLVSACIYTVHDGLEIKTSTDKIFKIRQDIIMLLLLRTPDNEYINELANEYYVKAPKRYFSTNINENCILCGLCVKACQSVGTSAISMVQRGITKKVSTPYDDSSKDCIGCGACAEVCPTNAIILKDYESIRQIWNKKFNLVKCSCCNTYFATEESLNFIHDKIKEKEKTNELLCNKCKRKSIGEKFKESYENFY